MASMEHFLIACDLKFTIKLVDDVIALDSTDLVTTLTKFNTRTNDYYSLGGDVYNYLHHVSRLSIIIKVYS